MSSKKVGDDLHSGYQSEVRGVFIFTTFIILSMIAAQLHAAEVAGYGDWAVVDLVRGCVRGGGRCCGDITFDMGLC